MIQISNALKDMCPELPIVQIYAEFLIIYANPYNSLENFTNYFMVCKKISCVTPIEDLSA